VQQVEGISFTILAYARLRDVFFRLIVMRIFPFLSPRMHFLTGFPEA
jgi:hypothetical protein